MAANEKQLRAVRTIVEHVAGLIDVPASVRLWDGTDIPLGKGADGTYYFSINEPGVVGALLRRPTLENVLVRYATGEFDFHGDIFEFRKQFDEKATSRALRKVSKTTLLKSALSLICSPTDKISDRHVSRKGKVAADSDSRSKTDFIQFHYDVSNEFYQLFLDPEMQYSCGYFKDWGNSLEQAQLDKLEMICRKLRLKEDERLLDIGCGWGGLVCYAARNYGVQAHGVTLSQRQLDFAKEKIKRLGLEDRVTVELRDYATLDGTYDKIASIGMYEHVGIANYPNYFGKIRNLLANGGIVLNHGITRRARLDPRKDRKVKPTRKFILKYIFPGSELDNVGHTVEIMEGCRLEVHDVEAWREHYGLTATFWARNLAANREKAIALVGREKFRLWWAYLAGVACGFSDGAMKIYQVVASKQDVKGPSGLPPTRADLYA
jgi:cyclopropane-fatty-acyl-phospholipid synthase